jgi:hypothetical protein
MASSRSTRADSVRRLIYVLSGVLLVGVTGSQLLVWSRAIPRTSPAAEQPNLFDLRFPTGFEPEHQAPQPEPGPIEIQSTAALKSPTAQVRAPDSPGTDPRRLRRIMDLGVTRYAFATDDEAKSKAISLVQIAAQLGYPPARELVVRNYPHSPAVRSTVPLQDAVRFALDLAAQESTSNENAELTTALGSYFSRRGEVLMFARHIVDAIAGDDRLQTADSLARLFLAFARVPGICTGIKRAISVDLRIDQDCSHSLIEELLDYERLKAGARLDADARARAMRLLVEFEQAHK